MDVLQPEDWPRPRGYSNGVKAHGELIFVAGQIGWDATEQIVSDDLLDQTRQALLNVLAVLDVGGASAEHVARMTWYVTDLEEYNARADDIGTVYREVMGKHYPAMSLVKVAGLLEPGAKVEIEATAVVPDEKDERREGGV